MMNTSEVTIAGAGPVGLITALGLAQAGVKVTVLDAEAQPNTSPRALVYHWAVMEHLERMGLLDDVIQRGIVKQDYGMKVYASGETISWSISALQNHVRHPFNIHLGQDELSRIILAKLSSLPNVEVRWGVRVKGVVSHEADVEVIAEAAGADLQFRSQWLVAADGARSSIRNLLNISFAGMTWPKRMVATNMRADLEPLGFEKAVFVIDETYGAIIVKIDRTNLWRVTYCEQPDAPEDGIAQRIPGMYAKLLPGIGDKFELLQFSPYRMHQRVAGQFRKGRVLFAGDAAHITNPVGGLGLTAGLFDAFVLYEALAAVVQGTADPTVLDHYADERKRNFLEITSPQATENNRLLFYSDDQQRLENDLRQIRRLQTDESAVRARTLFVGKLQTPSLIAKR